MSGLRLKTGFTFHPRSVSRKYWVRNVSGEDVSNVVFEFIDPATGEVKYSTSEDTRTISNGNELSYTFDLSGTTITGLFKVRASGAGVSGTTYTSNEVLVYVDDYFTYTSDIGGFMEIMWKGATVTERFSAGDVYIPKSAGRVMLVFDDNTVAVLGPDEMSAGTVERKGALVSKQEHRITFTSTSDLVEYLEGYVPEARDLIADPTALTDEQKIQFYLPFYHRKRVIEDAVVYVEYDSAGPALVEYQLVPRFGRLEPWTRGGGGGAGLAILAGLFALYEWYLHKHEEKTIKESASTIIDTVAETGKSISKQVEETAKSVVESTADSVWAIPKSEVIKKIMSVGASTREEITRIQNEAQSAVWGPKKPEPWYKRPEVLAALGFGVGVLIARKA